MVLVHTHTHTFDHPCQYDYKILQIIVLSMQTVYWAMSSLVVHPRTYQDPSSQNRLSSPCHGALFSCPLQSYKWLHWMLHWLLLHVALLFDSLTVIDSFQKCTGQLLRGVPSPWFQMTVMYSDLYRPAWLGDKALGVFYCGHLWTYRCFMILQFILKVFLSQMVLLPSNWMYATFSNNGCTP